MNLHEEARDWYYAEAESGVCVRHITDWTQFRAVFLRHAGLQQPSDLELEVRLLSLRQQGELGPYATEFGSQISRIASADSRTARILFINGLAPHLRRVKEVRESRTWVEAMQAAERHECKRKERVAEPGLASPGDAADGGSPRCFGCHAPDHEVRDCPERKAKKPQKKPVSKGKKQASRGAPTGADGAGGRDIEKPDRTTGDGPAKQQGALEAGASQGRDSAAPVQTPDNGSSPIGSADTPARRASDVASPELSADEMRDYIRPATINFNTVHCALSTAARVNCMEVNLARQLGLPLKPIAASPVAWKTARRPRGQLYWTTDVVVEFEDSAWGMDFLVGEMPDTEILLGLPYVNVAHPVIDYKELTWTETANL